MGSSKDILSRKVGHTSDSLKTSPVGFCRHLAKLGIDSFDFEILERCEPEARFEREKVWMIFFQSVKNGFNVKKDPTVGLQYVTTEEISRKISEANRKRVITDETRAKMRLATGGKNHPLFGTKHSEETRRKMAIAKLGKKASLETRLKLSKIHKGRPRTKSQMEAIMLSNRTRKYSQATIEKMRQSARARFQKNQLPLL